MRNIKFYLPVFFLPILFTAACSDLKDGLSSPQAVSVHGTDVQNLNAAAFHGRILTAQGFDQCRECHASDLSGGTAKVSCSTSNCHKGITVHTTGILDTASVNFHGNYIKEHIWDLSLCSQCHGETYSGGITSPSCNTCHIDTGGPEACNTCHGDFNDPSKIAPPRALDGTTLVSSPKVGAHSIHLFTAYFGKVTSCGECHSVPSKLTSSGHIDNDGKAEVQFLNSKTGIGSAASSYSYTTSKCTNTYCHGNFELSKSSSSYQFIYSSDKMSGLKKEMLWTNIDGTQTTCGSCHGLPPEGHVTYAINTCVVCHQGVVDSKGKITDASKHINGKVNVFGIEY